MATATATPIQKQSSESPDPGFDARLTMASVGMDVLLSAAAGSDLEDVQSAAEEAAEEVARYRAEEAARAAVAAQQAPPSTFTSHPVLKAAGDVIRSRGWHQGSWADTSGAVCAQEAIRVVCGGDPGREADALTVLRERIRHEVGHDNWSVPGWNDSRRSTREGVLRLLY